MRTLLLAALFAASGTAPVGSHPVSHVPQAQVPPANVPTAQRNAAAPQALTTTPVRVDRLAFQLPKGWVQQGDRFMPAGVYSVSVTVTWASPATPDARSLFQQKVTELGNAASTQATPTLETSRSGLHLYQTEIRTSTRNTAFVVADVGGGDAQTITYQADDQTAFANWHAGFDVILSTLSR